MPSARIKVKKTPAYWLVWLIFLLAFALRLRGNAFGLPYFFHPDEQRLTIPAWQIAERGQWNPGNFIYPTGFIYLLFFGFKLLSFFCLTFHNYQADLIMLHWLGRFYSALLGAGSVWLIYALGKKAYSASTGLAAALFLSLNFIHLRHSHYATTDIMNLFFVLLSIFFIFKSRLSWAGLFGGIATGVKYNAWPIIFPLLFASIRDKSLTGCISKNKSMRAIFFYLLGFSLATPFAFIDLRHFLSSLTEILVIPHSKWLGITQANPFYYFNGFKPLAGVGIIFILSLLGLFSRFKNWSRPDTILVTFFLPYTILASLTIIKLDRYLLPAIIIFLLWAALSLDKIALILSRLWGKPYLILAALAIGLSIHPLLKSIRYVQALEEKDTRLRAAEWIKKNIPPGGSHLALFSHPWANPPLSNDGYKITSIPLVYKNKDRDREIFKLRLVKCKVIASLLKKITNQELSPELLQNRIDHLPTLEDFTLFPLSYFKEKRVDYIIISGFLKDDLLDKSTVSYFPKLSRSASGFFREIEKETELIYSLEGVKEFGPDFALGPSLAIYKLK